jgi:hypothetical protein
LLFDVRGNQRRPTLIKSELCQNLKTDHKSPPKSPRRKEAACAASKRRP